MRGRLFAAALVGSIGLACGESAEAPGDAEASTGNGTESAASGAAEPASSEGHDHEAHASRPRGRPLPAFSGWTLEDEKLDISEKIGRRLLLYFFNPEVDDAEIVTGAINSIAGEQADYNFEIIGIATGSNRRTASAFTRRLDVKFDVIDDSNAAIARRLGLRSPMAVLGTDPEGFISFGIGQFATEDARAQDAIEANLRRALRLPDAEADSGSETNPPAPLFTATVLDSDEPFVLEAQRGRAVVLIFFLHTCSHCHEALDFLEEYLESLPEDQRPVLVGVEVTGRTHAVRQVLRDKGLDFFPVLFDDDGSIQADYGVFGSVPDTFLIDPEGRIRARSQGWRPDEDGPLLRMRIAKISGARVPMLLRTQGYSGNEVCGVCHELEHETWSYTNHASAYDTLVKHGADVDEECIGCHVVGWQQTGGFTASATTPGLEHVGCESCHGRGGPHLSPDFVTGGDYAAACLACHDAKHSLGFDYAAFRPRISHAANAHLTTLPPEEKARLLAAQGRPGNSLLPTNADYVGSSACESCHAAEFATWSASPHAGAVATLAKQGNDRDADCLACHTTGFGLPGGFPATAAPAEHPALAAVGCESCHGPGGDHVAEGAVRFGTILSLGDKCDSCVILKVCGSCHDDANDPGFEFEVLDKIELQRHGTIEPGTGKPKGTSAALDRRIHSDAARLALAFRVLDAGS